MRRGSKHSTKVRVRACATGWVELQSFPVCHHVKLVLASRDALIQLAMTSKNSFRDARHVNQWIYSMNGRYFYEQFQEKYVPTDELISTAKSALGAQSQHWQIDRLNLWYAANPPVTVDTPKLPSQGWKIHISATPLNCEEVLKKTVEVLLDYKMPFKFLIDKKILMMTSSKLWSRGASGKFITIYPRSEAEFRSVIERIYESIKDMVGPYILSDKRYKDCRCIYYRYGTFTPTYRLELTGTRTQVLHSPDGQEVPDVRHPYFNVPSWEADPFAANDSPDAAADLALNDGRFRILNVISRSNVGGVYKALDEVTGRHVVIKEARPCTEVHGQDDDAVNRLEHEYEILSAISELGVAPNAVAKFYDWENFYVAEEWIDAVNLRDFFLSKRPITLINPSHADYVNYYKDIQTVFVNILEAIDKIHGMGVVIGDISPSNILINRDTYSVTLIDLESAYRPGIESAAGISTLGFAPPSMTGVRETLEPESWGYAGDLYGIGSLLTYCLFPVSRLSYLRDNAFTDLLKILLSDNGLTDSCIYEVVQGLQNNTMTCRRACELLKKSIDIVTPVVVTSLDSDALPIFCKQFSKFLLDNCRLDENDRCMFPADPFALHTNMLSLGFGSAGVLYALKACGAEIPEKILHKFKKQIKETSAGDLPPGLLTGTAGVSMSLFSMGEHDEARRLLSYSNQSSLRFADHSLYYGAAGIGLANLFAYISTRERCYAESALEYADYLVKASHKDDNGTFWTRAGATPVGLGYGQSGVALFLLRLSQILGEDNWVSLGRNALEHDLSFGRENQKGALTFPRDTKTFHSYEPYVEEGSAGVMRVAVRYGLWDAVDRIASDLKRKYSVFPGYIYGLSGLADALIDAYVGSGDTKYLDMAQHPLSGIKDLYLLKVGNGNAVPGENMIKISCDYATGVAGVMRTIYRRCNPSGYDLFLDGLNSTFVRSSKFSD